MKQQHQKKGRRTKIGGFLYITALFVAFKKALKPQQMSKQITAKDVYFDFDNQVFLLEPKNRVTVTTGVLLFSTASKEAFTVFYNSVFTPMFKKTGKPVTQSDITFCKNQWNLKNNKNLVS